MSDPTTPPPDADPQARRRTDDPTIRQALNTAADATAAVRSAVEGGSVVGAARSLVGVPATAVVAGAFAVMLTCMMSMFVLMYRDISASAREADLRANRTEKVFADEVRSVREHSDRRNELLADEIRLATAEQRNVAAEIRRLTDQLIQANKDLKKAVEKSEKDHGPECAPMPRCGGPRDRDPFTASPVPTDSPSPARTEGWFLPPRLLPWRSPRRRPSRTRPRRRGDGRPARTARRPATAARRTT